MEILNLLRLFAPLFARGVWESAVVLVIGAILAPGKRTVSAILRVMELSQGQNYQTYYRVLNRAVWSSLKASRILLVHLLAVFAPIGPVVMVLDDTIERRRGKRIEAKGIYRDPVRSSQSHFVKTSGLRWLCLMLLVPIPWAQRSWALPFLTVLAPSQRYHQVRNQPHKGLSDWARQMLKQVRRWLPERAIMLVGDSSFATLELLGSLTHMHRPVHLITPLRLDAALYRPAPPRDPQRKGRPPIVGKRLPKLEALIDNPHTPWQTIMISDWYSHSDYCLHLCSYTAVWYRPGKPAVPIRWVLVKDPKGKFRTQALLCTDLEVAPLQMLKWFRLRWQVEVTFEEVRAHLGVESQRQWSALAIARTTPALMALFSIVTLLAHQRLSHEPFVLPQTAWYKKSLPTFSDALALVRQQVWQFRIFSPSLADTDTVKIPRQLFNTWADLLCYAA
jgi:hypothetical protein